MYKAQRNLIFTFQICLTKEVSELEKKTEDEHDETKPNLHRDWTIVILECFVMNYFSTLFGPLYKINIRFSIAEQQLNQVILYVDGSRQFLCFMSRHIALFVFSRSIKKLFTIDCVNIYLFSIFFFNRFCRVENCAVTLHCLYRDSLTLIPFISF